MYYLSYKGYHYLYSNLFILILDSDDDSTKITKVYILIYLY